MHGTSRNNEPRCAAVDGIVPSSIPSLAKHRKSLYLPLREKKNKEKGR
jgi:hypothetical protein